MKLYDYITLSFNSSVKIIKNKNWVSMKSYRVVLVIAVVLLMTAGLAEGKKKKKKEKSQSLTLDSIESQLKHKLKNDSRFKKMVVK